MRVLTTNIVIGDFAFSYVHELEVESSWEMLTDKCTILLPSSLKLDKNAIRNVLKKGDKVAINIGYDNNLQTVFKGYLTEIKPSTPIELMCEDEMWILKQKNIIASSKGKTLNEFISEVIPEVELDAFEIMMSPFHVNNLNAAKMLDKIKSEYGLRSFFRDGKLTIGKQYDPSYAQTKVFKLDFNIIEDDLEYKAKEDVKVKIKAISNNADGTKTEVEFGDLEGDSKTLNFYNLSKEDLEVLARKELDRLVYDGWRGSFEAFGEPYVRHGDIVELRHNEDSDKTGNYWVDAVTTTYGINGYRQSITLGART